MTIPLFLIPILVGLATQFSKRFFNKEWKSTLNAHGYYLPHYGGMPSAHTSFAFSLATTVFLSEGIASTSFAITVALVIFILDDALRMRVFLSGHGLSLAKLIDRLPTVDQGTFPALEKRLGHTLAEVVIGALVGILLTVPLYAIVGG